MIYPAELTLDGVERYSKEYWRLVNLRKKFKRVQDGKCRNCGCDMSTDKKWWNTINERSSSVTVVRVCVRCCKKRSSCRAVKRAKFRKLGLCGECGNPPAPGKRMCESCRLRSAQQRTKRNRMLKLSGRCMNCSKKFTEYTPGPKTPAYCDECLLKQKMKRLSKTKGRK